MADPKQAAGETRNAAQDGANETRNAVQDTARHPARNTQIAAHEMKRDVEQHPKAVAGGAATGAGAGAVVGGPPGAIVGAITGALRGLVAADAWDVLKKRFGEEVEIMLGRKPRANEAPATRRASEARRAPGPRPRPRGVIRGPIVLPDDLD